MATDDRYLDDIQRYQYETDTYDRNYYTTPQRKNNYQNYNDNIYDEISDHVVSKYEIEQKDVQAEEYLKTYQKNSRSQAVQKAERMKRIRGLLFRIILACSIFILLFFGKLCSVELFEYNTERVIEQVENNSWVESLEQKLKGILFKEK